MNEINLSSRSLALQASEIRIIAEEAMNLQSVIPLYFGESAWQTDPLAVGAAIDALQHGDHFYQPNNGRKSLREAISRYLSKLHSQPIDADRITVTASGTQALAITAQAIVDPGDNVLCIQPGWPNIPCAFEIAGAKVQYQHLGIKDDRWNLDIDRFTNSITPQIKAVLINSPSNPTGWVMPSCDQEVLLEKCRKTGTWLVFDEVYSRLYQKGKAAPSPLDFALPDDRVISINSFSKAWSMTGWRLGWVAAPKATYPTLGKLTEFNIACAPGFVQAAGENMINAGEKAISDLKHKLEQSYTEVETNMKTIEKIGFIQPDGAFYLFFSIDGIENSLEFARRLLRETGVGLAPGSAFGEAGSGYFRLCYANPVTLLSEALSRLDGFLQS
ncbi:MAG: pyridoxal phosphate-dependent aminotransferase [Acidiferrobacterales bacterium]|nr:pyridoxal phosphate-dependent aminotransferase [Acidiferrobacterales bacterium]